MMTLGAKPAFDTSKFLALVHQMEVREAAFLKAIPDIVVGFDPAGKCLFFYPGSGMQWPFAINDLTGRFLNHCFPQDLVERCTCSPERIEDMLATNFSAEERDDMTVDGEIEVVCEFCSAAYRFNPHQFNSDK